MLNRPRYESLQRLLVNIAEHRVRLPRSCLPIRENRTVVPVHYIADRFVTDRFINAMLARIRIEDEIHREHSLLWEQHHRLLVGIQAAIRTNFTLRQFIFDLIQRTESRKDFRIHAFLIVHEGLL